MVLILVRKCHSNRIDELAIKSEGKQAKSRRCCPHFISFLSGILTEDAVHVWGGGCLYVLSQECPAACALVLVHSRCSQVCSHTRQVQFMLPIGSTLPGGFSFPKAFTQGNSASLLFAFRCLLKSALWLSFKYTDCCKQCPFGVLLGCSSLGYLFPPVTFWSSGKVTGIEKHVRQGGEGYSLSV